MLEEIVKELGFESEQEFHFLVSQVDITTQSKNKAFKDWQFNDGTKQGILKLDKLPERI